MIWGIDHLVMSTSLNANVGTALKELGFECDFIDSDVPSAPEKTPILSKPRPLHDIEFYRPTSSGLAVEAIAHGADRDQTPGPYIPVFQVETLPAGEVDSTTSECLGKKTVRAEFHDTQAFYSVDKQLSSTLNTVVLNTPSINSESDFWTDALGFKIVSDGPNWQLLETSTPVAAWSGELLLKKDDSVLAGPMDGHGFTCLALVSNDIDRDLENAYAQGGTSYDCRFEIAVNDRPLIVALFRTPGGALVEFIQNVK